MTPPPLLNVARGKEHMSLEKLGFLEKSRAESGEGAKQQQQEQQQEPDAPIEAMAGPVSRLVSVDSEARSDGGSSSAMPSSPERDAEASPKGSKQDGEDDDDADATATADNENKGNNAGNDKSNKDKAASNPALLRSTIRAELSKGVSQFIKNLPDGTFACSICDRAFVWQNSLVRHITCVHAGIKNFQCQRCGKSFKGRHGLKYHLGAKSCLKGKSNLLLHQHQPSAAPPRKGGDGDGSFPCHICGKSFPVYRVLTRHIKTVHENVGAFKCPRCPKAFKSKQGLQYHTDHSHSDNGAGHGAHFLSSHGFASPQLGPTSAPHMSPGEMARMLAGAQPLMSASVGQLGAPWSQQPQPRPQEQPQQQPQQAVNLMQFMFSQKQQQQQQIPTDAGMLPIMRLLAGGQGLAPSSLHQGVNKLSSLPQSAALHPFGQQPPQQQQAARLRPAMQDLNAAFGLGSKPAMAAQSLMAEGSASLLDAHSLLQQQLSLLRGSYGGTLGGDKLAHGGLHIDSQQPMFNLIKRTGN